MAEAVSVAPRAPSLRLFYRCSAINFGLTLVFCVQDLIICSGRIRSDSPLAKPARSIGSVRTRTAQKRRTRKA